jgi:hypothetical protein
MTRSSRSVLTRPRGSQHRRSALGSITTKGRSPARNATHSSNEDQHPPPDADSSSTSPTSSRSTFPSPGGVTGRALVDRHRGWVSSSDKKASVSVDSLNGLAKKLSTIPETPHTQDKRQTRKRRQPQESKVRYHAIRDSLRDPCETIARLLRHSPLRITAECWISRPRPAPRTGE